MSSRKSPIKIAKKQDYLRRGTAQSIVELCCALIVVVPLLLILIDCLFIFMGASLNDSICRDAARAAASGPPSSLDQVATPKERALTVIKYVYYSGLPMKVSEYIDVVETVRDAPPSSQGGGVDGEITVGTTITIYPPFLVSYIAAGKVELKSQHTAPITYVLPAS